MALEYADKTAKVTLAKPLELHGGDLEMYKSHSQTLVLPQLTQVCKLLEVTPSSIFRTAWAIVLQQYTQSNHVVFGSVVSGRDGGHPGAERMVGMLINTVPILVHIPLAMAASQCVQAVHAYSTGLLEHAHCSLSDIQHWIGTSELFDTILAYANYPQSELHKSNAPRPFSIELQGGEEFVDVPICVAISPKDPDSFDIKITFKCKVVDEAIVQFMAHRFTHVLSVIANITTCDQVIGDIGAISHDEQRLAQGAMKGTQVPLPYDLLHHAFEEKAREHPGLPAVEYGQSVLRYGDLDEQANTLAVKLTALGVQVGHRVAVIMERCLEFPIGLLAALKTGASMMPLDAAFPPDRLKYMLTDASVSVVVSTNEHCDHIAAMMLDIPIVYISSRELALEPTSVFLPHSKQIATALDEAYVVYTSGSSGKPKGVPVIHGGATNVMVHSSAPVGIVQHARVMQFMAVSFDGFQMDMWKCLSHGATLVLRDNDFMETLKLSIDAFACTPTALGLLGHPRNYPRVKVVSVGGEACPLALKDLWAPYVRFMNLYGPSECAIMTHYAELQPGDPITIGRPLENVHSYILDSNQRPVPVGVVGELCLGGVCVSPGYINLPHQTNERFIPDPFVQGGVMFRTGDLGRLLLDGNFELLGREDSQVKLKGYRIELDEVAGAMMQHPDVVSAAVIVKDKSHLVGYFTPASVAIEKLQQVVAAHLPVYMVPAVWVGLDVMPQNSNGKTDKNALQAMEVEVQVEALETESERRMAKIWAQVLGVNVNDIGRRTSFFSIGGDSISAIHVASAAREVGCEFALSGFLKSPLLWEVALSCNLPYCKDWPVVKVALDTLAAVGHSWNVPLELTEFEVYPTTSLQSGMVFATLRRRDAYVFQHHLQLRNGLNDVTRMVNVITQLAEAYDILRTTFVTVPSGVLQVIHTGLQHLQVANADAASIDAFLEADHRRGFEVGDKCFSRFSMVQTPLSSTLYCVLTMHHALYDGWTIAMLLRDLYDLLHDERPLVPRPSFRRVVDYIQAQDQRDTETFWRGYLHGLNVHLIALGTVQHGVASPGSAATRRPTSIALQLNEIQEASKRVGLTVAEFTRLVWALTLRKYTRHNDVIFGQVLSNRNLPVSDVARYESPLLGSECGIIRDMPRILGPLISTVPCRVTFDESSNSLRGAIASIQAQRGALVGHSYASLVDMKRWSGVVDNVFDTVLAFQQLPAIWDFGPGSSTYDIAAPHAVEHTLEVTIWPNETHLTVLARHDPTRLTDEHARQILEEMRHTSGQVYALSHDLDDDSSMLWDVSDTQRGWIDASSFGPQTILPYELVHHAFEARATSHPTTPAIEFEGTCLTYGQLNDRANTLAAQLYCMGVGVGHRVGVVMERCLEFPTALLAALKVGASMMPLDAAFPVSRLLYMLADANAFVVVTTDKHRHLVESMTLGIPFVCISSRSTDAASSQPIKASRCNATRTDEAYVVYTSGSSGTPKGVPVTHAAAVNVSHFRSVETGFVPGHRVMQFMAIGFDGFQWDLWKCLSNGATLVLRSHEVLHELKSIHAFTCTPTALFLLGHPSEFPSLRVVSVAGETCPLVLKDLWAPYVRFMNLYGPSECAIMTHYAELQ
ncbi:hypothetical protein DYB34_006487, partial [Aphanomyces astaci]